MLLPEHINFVSMVLCCTCATLVNLAILEFCFLTVWSIAFGFFKEILYGLGLDLLFYQYFPGCDLSVCYLILGFLFSYLNKFDILHVEDLEFIIKTIRLSFEGGMKFIAYLISYHVKHSNLSRRLMPYLLLAHPGCGRWL